MKIVPKIEFVLMDSVSSHAQNKNVLEVKYVSGINVMKIANMANHVMKHFSVCLEHVYQKYHVLKKNVKKDFGVIDL